MEMRVAKLRLQVSRKHSDHGKEKKAKKNTSVSVIAETDFCQEIYLQDGKKTRSMFPMSCVLDI